MSTENTTENNKLLAEFLHGTNAIHPNQYHDSWNELMQVVEKIEGLRDGRCLMDNDDILAYVTIESQYCEIRVYDGILEPEKEYPTKIEAVYCVVVQFVKWYNSKPELHV